MILRSWAMYRSTIENTSSRQHEGFSKRVERVSECECENLYAQVQTLEKCSLEINTLGVCTRVLRLCDSNSGSHLSALMHPAAMRDCTTNDITLESTCIIESLIDRGVLDMARHEHASQVDVAVRSMSSLTII
jgi:hypothetical protein